MEALAAVEHERWAHWQRTCTSSAGRGMRITVDPGRIRLQPLAEQMATPYDALSEDEKESDQQVRKYLPIVRRALSS